MLAVAATAHARSPEPAVLQRARQRAMKGESGWDPYLDRLSRLRPSVFQQGQLRQSSPARFRLLEENRAGRFAILRDRKALRRVEKGGDITAEHLLGIPIGGGPQPIWLNRIPGSQAAMIGRVTRETLEAPRRVHGRDAQTLVYYHLPGNISQPIVHAHGIWRPKDRPMVKRWPGLLRRGYRQLDRGEGYALYRARPGARGLAGEWPIVAVAQRRAGRSSQLGPETDALLGRMILEVAQATLKHAPPSTLVQGRIEVDRADSRIVVRLVRRRQPTDTTYW